MLEGFCSDATGRDGRDGFFGVESRPGSVADVCEATQGGDKCDVKAYDTGPECTTQSNVGVGRPDSLSINRVRTRTDRAFLWWEKPLCQGCGRVAYASRACVLGVHFARASWPF